MTNWIFNMLKQATQKTAEENAQEQDKQVQGDIFKDVMDIDEKELKQEADIQQAGIEEARGYKKEAAYNVGDTSEETVKHDYKLEISGLSDYNLAEMLAEAATHDKQSTTVNFNEEKEKQLKSVKSDRSAAETKVYNLVKDHTLDDWKKAFKNISDYEHKVATEEELRGKDWKKSNWRTNDKDFKAVSDDDKEKDMEGVGGEEEKGQVGKEARLDMHDTDVVNLVKAAEYATKVLLSIKDEYHSAKANPDIDTALQMLDYGRAGDSNIETSKKAEYDPKQLARGECEKCHGDVSEVDAESGLCKACYDETHTKKADENLEQEVELDLPAQETKDLPEENVVPLEPTLDVELEKPKEKVDDKITQKIDEKVEEKTEEIAEKIEEKIEEHADEMAEKVETKVEEKIEEAFEEHHEDHHDDVLPTGLSDTHEDEEKEKKPEESKDDDKDDDNKDENKKEDEKEEIPAAASKKDTLKKIAEIESPWKVIKDENGVESIARVVPKNTKVSKDDEENDKVSKDLN